MLDPKAVATDTSAVPVPAGAVAVIVVDPVTVTAVAGTPPNDTVAGETNPLPISVTVFPPASGPEAGLTELSAGFGGTGEAAGRAIPTTSSTEIPSPGREFSAGAAPKEKTPPSLASSQ